MIRRTLSVVAVLLAVGSIHAAQEDRGPQQQPLQGGMRGMREPMHDLHESLKPLGFFEGFWKVDQTMKPSEHTPGGTSDGLFMIRRDLGGRALLGHFRSKLPDGRMFYGHMVITAERGAAGGQERRPEYQFFWSDSEGITTLSRATEVTDQRLVVEATDKVGEKRGTARVTYNRESNDRIQFVMEKQTDKGWEKLVVGTYTRTQPSAENVRYEGGRKQQQ